MLKLPNCCSKNSARNAKVSYVVEERLYRSVVPCNLPN